MSRMDEIKVVMAEVNKKHGNGTIVLASQVSDVVPRVTSGSLALDLILGGGWPANQWVEIIGNESSGKTAVALKTIAANQERDPEFTCVWFASEKWVSEYASMCGVDLERVAVVETSSMEDVYNMSIKFANSRAADCIVIDSLPALLPSAEDDKEMGESTIGKAAILTAGFFRKVGKATKRSLIEQERPVFGIVINQWRQKIGVVYGDNRTTPGGLAKNYAYFIRVEVRRGDWIEIGSHEKERIGQAIHLRTIKNKTAPAQRTAVVDFYFSTGGDVKPGEYDLAKEIAALAVMDGIIERSGSYYNYGPNKWRGQQPMLQSLREDLDLYDSIHHEVMDVILKSAR